MCRDDDEKGSSAPLSGSNAEEGGGGGERRACSAAAVGHVHRAVCVLLQHIGCGVVGAELEANRINACKQSCKYISVHSLGMLLPSRPASLPWPAVFHSTARYSVME